MALLWLQLVLLEGSPGPSSSPAPHWAGERRLRFLICEMRPSSSSDSFILTARLSLGTADIWARSLSVEVSWALGGVDQHSSAPPTLHQEHPQSGQAQI